MNESVQKPAIHFFTRVLGSKSEVWMHRQATSLEKVNAKIICGKHENADVYPAKGQEVCEFPVLGQPRNKLARYAKYALNALANSGRGFFIGHPNTAKAIVDCIDRHHPKCVLFHYGITATRYAPLYFNSGIPMLVHFNGFDMSSQIRVPQYYRQLKKLIPRMAGFVVVANYMREQLLEMGASGDRIHHIPYGVPVDDFTPSTALDSESCKFLMVGRLTPKKAPQISIRAFAQSLQRAPNSTLTIVGDGELRAECEKLVHELKLDDKIEFLGAQLFDRVKQEMSSSSVFIQHSVTPASGDKEGWPVAIAEAAASALPIVSTNHASIPEQVVDNKTGFVVHEQDASAMAEAMTKLALDPEKRSQFGAASRKHISQWDLPNQIAKLDQLLFDTAIK